MEETRMNYRDYIEFGVLKINTCLKNNVQTLTAATTLTASSPNYNVLNSATEFAVTLPAPAEGLTYRFIVGAAPAGASYTVVTNSSANIISGVVSSADLNGAADMVVAALSDTITFADGVAAVGDWVELVSDGTYWFLSGCAKTVAGIVGSQAS